MSPRHTTGEVMTGEVTTGEPMAERTGSTAAAQFTWSQRRALAWIEAYQRAFAGRPSPCRFFPTCSHYAHEAYELHGTARGSWLTLRRLVRCRPLGPSGFDPVPVPDDAKSQRDGHVHADSLLVEKDH